MAWCAFAVAVGVGVATLLTLEQLLAALSNPGIWVPVSLLVGMVAGGVLLRRAFRREVFNLDGARVVSRPSRLRGLVQGRRERSLGPEDLTRVRTLPGRAGVSLVAEGEGEASPVVVPLQHGSAPRIVERLLSDVPASSWDPAAREGLASFVADAEVATRPGAAGTDGYLRYCRCAGLWHLAAAPAWSDFLAHRADPRRAAVLYDVERQRLPTAQRLRLARALLGHHGDETRYAVDAARFALLYRLRDDALSVLDDLVRGEAAGEVPTFWRKNLRERRALPAPGSKATFGIEVNLPDHRIDGQELVVDGRWRVSLAWFLGYRLLPGFWAPHRALELVDLWGARHLLVGDPVDWAVRLTAAAPHLVELHDEGLLWPPVGGRLRAAAA